MGPVIGRIQMNEVILSERIKNETKQNCFHYCARVKEPNSVDDIDIHFMS